MTFEPGDDELRSPADPDGFARDLASRVTEALEDRGRSEAFGAAGRRRVEERFSWQAIAAETAALYRRLAG